MMQDLYIIDAAGYCYRSYFAIRGMTNGQGESTNSLFGFIRSVLKIFKDLNPSHCVAVFDGKDNGRTRTAIYPAYKAHRQTMPPDLLHQINWAKEFCRLMGISVVDQEGIEADDVIGAIALHHQEAHVYICSTDKDLCQLVSENITMIDTYKDNLKIGPEQVQEKFGVPPALIVDYLALLGDASDNIPGVPGIGPKTAASLLNTAGSLEALFEHHELIPAKKREHILEHKDAALVSKKLATLQTDISFPEEELFYQIKPPLTEELISFYTTMQFHSLIREMAPKTQSPSPSIKFTIVDDIKALIDTLKNEKALAISCLTTTDLPMTADLLGIGLGTEENIWYIPFEEGCEEALKPLFENPHLEFFGHNIKFDYHVLKNKGLLLKNIQFDTLLASYILNSHNRNHSLAELALEHFGIVKTDLASLTGKGKSQIAVKDISQDKLASFCSETIDFILRLKHLFAPQLVERGFTKLYYELELPLLKVLAEMEHVGIYLDLNALLPLKQYLTEQIGTLSNQIYALAGKQFNLNSPLQLGKILFEDLGLPASKGRSTGNEVLEELKSQFPIAGKIQEYRGLEKLRSTYVETLPEQVHHKTHRIHCTFNQSVAATGRLSCQDPNLQNIPIRSETGLLIREAFRPEKEGWSYIGADYSQIELRLLAHFSDDPVLIAAFLQGEDIHAHTASRVFHVPIEEVSKEMRFKAKAVNFGIIYGQGAFGLSQVLGISQKEAGAFITRYFEQYPKVKQFLESCKDSARATGKAVTLFGRERLLPEILSKNIQIRNAAERLAVNTPFQGSAADLIKMAMLNISNALAKTHTNGYMILQIHDELIFEVPDAEIDFFKSLIKDKMENVVSLKVPLTVDLQVGKNWKAC